MRRKRISRSLHKSTRHQLSTRRKRAGRFGSPRLGLELLEPRQLLAAASFQQGVGGYSGTNDTVLFSISPTVNFGTDTGISVDQQDLNGERQGLLKFDNIFGPDPDHQIPLGSTINSATLTLSIFNESNSSALI